MSARFCLGFSCERLLPPRSGYLFESENNGQEYAPHIA